MRTTAECLPCLTRQILSMVERFWSDPTEQERAANGFLRVLADQGVGRSAPVIVACLQRALRAMLGDADPFREMKRLSNAMAMEWYAELRQVASTSADPFEALVRLAIAGNIIDFGLKGDVGPEEVRACLDGARTADIDTHAIDQLRRRIDSARTILYLADNAGELVFDKLLIEHLPMDRVTVAVKSSPTLNDVTVEDAEQIGLSDLVRIVGNGTDILGTVLEECSEEFRSLMRSADLVIAKGQANFESLSEFEGPVSFLFMVKCPLVARRLGCPDGSLMVLNRGM